MNPNTNEELRNAAIPIGLTPKLVNRLSTATIKNSDGAKMLVNAIDAPKYLAKGWKLVSSHETVTLEGVSGVASNETPASADE